MKTTILKSNPKEEIEKTILSTLYLTETATFEELKELQKILEKTPVNIFTNKYKKFLILLKNVLAVRKTIPPSSEIYDFYIKEISNNKRLAELFEIENEGILIEIVSKTPVTVKILQELIEDLKKQHILTNLKNIL